MRISLTEFRRAKRSDLSLDEIMEKENGLKIFEHSSGTFSITVTRMVEPDGDGGSHASAWVEGEASGVFRLTEPVLRKMVERSVQGDYERLKRVLEGEDKCRFT
jgi:hypothetical protein